MNWLQFIRRAWFVTLALTAAEHLVGDGFWAKTGTATLLMIPIWFTDQGGAS